MPEVLLSTRSLPPSVLDTACSAQSSSLYAGRRPAQRVSANRPYLLGAAPSPRDEAILATLRLAPPDDLRNLSELTQTHDPDTTLALAELMGRLREYQAAGAGAAAGVYTNRIDGLTRAVADYQDALLRYRKAVDDDASSAIRRMAKEHAHKRFAGYTDLMVDGAPSPHQSDTTLRWLIVRLRS